MSKLGSLGFVSLLYIVQVFIILLKFDLLMESLCLFPPALSELLNICLSIGELVCSLGKNQLFLFVPIYYDVCCVPNMILTFGSIVHK